VPTRALIANFVVGILFLLPLPSWRQIVPVTGTLAVFTFSIGSVSLLAFRRTGVTGARNRLPGMSVISPFAFVVSALVIYWVGWSDMRKTLFIVVPGLIYYAVLYFRQRHTFDDLRGGLWLVAHLAFLYALSALGSFGGAGLIASPWDSVIVAVVSIGAYAWGTNSGTTHLRANPDVMRRVDDAEPAAVRG
jgi:hypothetical protein